MFALLLVSLFGGASSTTLEQISSASTTNWNPIAMSADGSKAMASANDQIYLSLDGGATWPRNSKRANMLTFSPDGSKLFAYNMMTANQIQMSSDDGQTWTEIGESLSWNGLATNTDATKLAGAVWEGNIHLSADSGATWTDSGIGPQKWRGVAMSADGTKIGAVAEDSTKLFMSSDSGATFSEVDVWALAGVQPMSSAKWRSIDMSSDGTKIVVGAQSGGVLTSLDSGASWTEGRPGGWRSYTGVGISDDGMTVLAAHYGNGNGQVWISYDGGASFAALATEGYFQQMALTADGSKFIVTASGSSTGGLYLGTVIAPTVTMTNTTTATTATTTGTMTMTMTMTETVTMTDTSGAGTTMTSTSVVSEDSETTTTAPPNVVEVTLTLTVDDPATITENKDVTDAMITGFATVMNVDASQVTLEFEVARRLDTRRLQVTLLAIFSVTLPSAEEAEQVLTAIETVSVEDTSTAISDAVVGAGFAGTIEVTGKAAQIQTAPKPSSGCFVQNLAFVAGLVVLPFF